MARADLKNPYVIVAISLIIVIFSGVSYRKMAVDIVPGVNLPVVVAVTF